VEYDDEFKEIPLGAIISASINSKNGRAETFTIEYNYYEFRSRVQIREALFVVCDELYCKICGFKKILNSKISKNSNPKGSFVKANHIVNLCLIFLTFFL
jgi:hypothetical protein